MRDIQGAIRGQFLTLATCLLLGACASKIPVPPVGFTAADLGKQNKGLVVLGAQVTDMYQAHYCQPITVYYDQLEGNLTVKEAFQARGYAGEYEDTKLGLLARELPPGSYGVSRVDCKDFGNTIAIYLAGKTWYFASFSVEAGEVIDLGLLSLDVLLPKPELFDFSAQKEMSAMVFVDPIPEGFYQKMLRPDILAQMRTRHMQPNPPVTPAAFAERCTLQKAARPTPVINLGNPGPPPVCGRLAGGITISDRKFLENGAR